MSQFITITATNQKTYIINKRNIAMVEENTKGGITLTIVIGELTHYYHTVADLHKFKQLLNEEY